MMEILLLLGSVDGKKLVAGSDLSPYLYNFDIEDGYTSLPITDPQATSFASPPDGASSIAVSPDGKFISVAGIGLYYAGEAVRPSGAIDASGGYTIATAWSSDGSYLAQVGISGAKIWSRSGDTFTPLTGLSPSQASLQSCALSSDGTYFATTIDSSPYVLIYKNNGSGTFTKLSNPASLPPGAARAVALSPNNTYLAVGSLTSPYLTIYSRAGDTFTKLITQPTIDGATVTRLAWSPDGTYLAAIYQTGSRLAVWKQSGTTFTALSRPGTANLPDGIGRTCAWDGNRLAVGSSTTITLYDISSTAITRASDNFSPPTANWDALAYTPAP